jgi:hypothetical protein
LAHLYWTVVVWASLANLEFASPIGQIMYVAERLVLPGTGSVWHKTYSVPPVAIVKSIDLDGAVSLAKMGAESIFQKCIPGVGSFLTQFEHPPLFDYGSVFIGIFG